MQRERHSYTVCVT